MKLSEIQIRDPYVYTENGRYYLYGSTSRDIWHDELGCFEAYVSADLREWQPLGDVFDRPQGYWGTKNFWAPELHRYEGKYYLFASFKAEGVCRGTAVLKSDSPEGPFRPWSERALTPATWECLDGTLYVEDGAPYLVFCHEWVQVGDGEILYMPLTHDLSAPAGEPTLMCRAGEAAWARVVKHSSGMSGYVTDGPNMYKTASGALLMLWSTLSPAGYAIGCARSANGRLSGPWTHEAKPLFDKDGGHGMIFTAFSGKKYLSIHSPNNTPEERALFIETCERGDTLYIPQDADIIR
ncbi:MAG: family 43 glycosylhydrolase [Clostridia bacterium]|nr:family 43 glycosylhydrolase [Clostridia bacterium]